MKYSTSIFDALKLDRTIWRNLYIVKQFLNFIKRVPKAPTQFIGLAKFGSEKRNMRNVILKGCFKRIEENEIQGMRKGIGEMFAETEKDEIEKIETKRKRNLELLLRKKENSGLRPTLGYRHNGQQGISGQKV